MSFKITLDSESRIIDIKTNDCGEIKRNRSSFFVGLKGKHVSYLTTKDFWFELKNLNDQYLNSFFYQQVNSYFFSTQEIDSIENEKLLCRCVSYKEESFVHFLKENPSVEESEIGGLIQVGAGCGSCLVDVHRIYASVNTSTITPFELVIRLNKFLQDQKLESLKITATKNYTIVLNGKNDGMSVEILTNWFMDYPTFSFVINPEE